jgi:hypothetical protein
MKRLLLVCLAVLTAAAFLPERADARDGYRARQRIVIYRGTRYEPGEPGAIYGYAPGVYVPGPYGILYGPYPLRRYAAEPDLRD